ncbi:MAG: GNAT family acetyltransferase [Pseudomonadota bacterium]
MDMDIEIRTYRESDREGVISLWEIVFPGSAVWNKSDQVISTKLSTQPELFFVAIEKDSVVGTILAGFDGVRGWVHRLAVSPEWRRQGLASMLMRKAETGLKDIGCPKLNLQVRASNLEVLKFYESLGYTVEQRASLGKVL